MLAGVTLSHPVPVTSALTASPLPLQHPFTHAQPGERELGVLLV